MSGSSLWRKRPPTLGSTALLRHWLCEPGSLTARLQRHGSFRLVVLRQHLHHANADEEAALGLPPRACCWVREVLLFRDNIPVVFAHTVLPVEPAGVLGRWFAGLGGKSLGSLLFAHPRFTRGDLSFARIDRRHPLHLRAAAALGDIPARLQARRCVHSFGKQSILVTEVFLPAIVSSTQPGK